METETGRSKPRTSGYADVNGLHMYYEEHGEGSPLVLLHGGMLTIDLSFGTLELGVSYPDRVRSLVPASTSVRPDGLHEDLTDPARQATSTRLPTQLDYLEFQEAYRRLSPHPGHFGDFLTALSQAMAAPPGWTGEQLTAITAPTLLVMGDHDFTTVEHGALMQQLIPGAQLAVLPGTTHM
jgi:pimeloyl-ACP methyl ester carboxylesterase